MSCGRCGTTRSRPSTTRSRQPTSSSDPSPSATSDGWPGCCPAVLSMPWSCSVRFRPWRLRPGGSGQGEEELLQGLDVHRLLSAGLRQTLLETGADDGEASPVQGVVDRSELGDDVLAVAAFLDHAQDATDLALGPA